MAPSARTKRQVVGIERAKGQKFLQWAVVYSRANLHRRVGPSHVLIDILEQDVAPRPGLRFLVDAAGDAPVPWIFLPAVA